MEAGRPLPAHDWVRKRMSAQKTSGTRPELELRRLLHARGLRYRVAFPVPGMPRRTIDIAFTRAKLAVLVDGCFWHGCPVHAVPPRNNAAWWAEKLERNRQRDSETNQALEAAGWRVARFWEHESAEASARRVVQLLGAQRPSRSGRGALG